MALPEVYLAPPYPGAVAIYSLIDPRDGETRYIGKSVNPARRYRKHLRSPIQRPEFYSSRWIATVQQAGLQPLLRILDWVDPDCWERAEAHYIALARLAGARLTNATNGGEGHAGLRPDLEGRRKLSAAQTMRWARTSPEERAQITAPMLVVMRRIWAERRAAKGLEPRAPGAPRPVQARPDRTPLRERDPEAYHARRSEIARKGQQTRREKRTTPYAQPRRKHAPFGSPEHKAKLSAAHKGKPLPPEHRAKIGAAHKGRQFSDESRAKMSASSKGRVMSVETRAKMSASRKAYCERRKVARSVGVADAINNPGSAATEAYEQLRLPGT